jgi:hypothetical protein
MSFTFVTFNFQVRRPRDYQPLGPDSYALNTGFGSSLPSNIPDSMNKLFIGGLPNYLQDEQVMLFQIGDT